MFCFKSPKVTEEFGGGSLAVPHSTQLSYCTGICTGVLLNNGSVFRKKGPTFSHVDPGFVLYVE